MPIDARVLTSNGQRLAFDRASVRTYDQDGRLHVEVTPISKANVCPYLGSEIPDAGTLGLDAQRMYRLLRDPAELARAAPTFNGIPLIDAFDETGREHVQVSASVPRKELVVGSTGSDAVFDAPYLKNSLVVWDAKAIHGIEDETRREISSAYYYRADMTPGTWEGEAYDGVMRDIRGTHIALVRAGRAGPDVAVGDSALEIDTMGSKTQQTKLSRKAVLARGALLAHLKPMAADAKQTFGPVLTPVLVGITRANWQAGKSALVAALRPKLAADADIANLVSLLDSLDDEGNDDDVAQDEPPRGEPVEGVTTASSVMQDADPVGEILGSLRGKLSDGDLASIEQRLRALKLAADQDDDGAAADTPPATPGTPAAPTTSAAATAGDAAPVSRPVMDAAIAAVRKDARVAMDAAMRDAVRQATQQAAKDAETAAIRRMRAVADAETFVQPWVGHLAIAQDSADEVYRAALATLGVDIGGIHPSAFRAILEAQPKAGTQRARVALDSASVKSFAERYPHAAAIKQLG